MRTTINDVPARTARRLAWFVGIWAASAAATIAVAFALRLVIFRIM